MMGAFESELIKIRRELHKIPEIGLQEFQTSEYLLNKINLLAKNADNVEIKQWQTGIVVLVRGTASEKTIGWRTDIDGLPVLEETDLPFSSERKGFMHACGHDFHMTIALGLLHKAIETPAKNDRVFLFQPAEENEAGGKLMYDAGVLDEWMPDEFYAAHVKPDLATGVISTRTGTIFASGSEVQVKFIGKSGHAALPQQANDMIVAASQFVLSAQTIVARNVDPLQSAVITFGAMNAGIAGNVIAGECKLYGTMRALTMEMSDLLEKRLREVANGIAQTFDCAVEILVDQKGYYPVVNDEHLAIEFMKFVQAEDYPFELSKIAMTGEDFGYLIDKIPGVMFWLGVNSEYPLHNSKMNPDENAIFQAVEIVDKWLTSRANG